ncbi:glycosyl hydrolase family 28 protein [Lacrimispora indolis]|uniref:glycosyl hydrolase family 28 protein n=1 Tax=Lacrimispora indolis TaxID=69825 RepID=UPI00045EC0E7|nr:glycoside hydrolase family 28 protein [Lacrimispora indolis]
MKFRVIFKTARKITIELLDAGIFYTDFTYDIYINGKNRMTSRRVVETVDGLKPDTEYTIQVVGEGTRSETVNVRTDYEFVTLDIKKFGAVGDGAHDDTLAIQAAISSCPLDSRVLIPKGIYRVSSIFLKSNITIDLAEGAVLSAFTEREKFAVLPGLIESWDEQEEYNLGSWEGNPLRMFSSIITGIGVTNVVITGKGVIDGNASYNNWWNDFRTIKGAYRPRMIFLNNCENITLHEFTTRNTPAWNIHPYFSRNLRFIGLHILNPKVSPNTDGMDPESCNGVEIVGTYFSVGDDCIAIKSGKIYMGKKYKEPSQNIEIRQCCMKDGHGSVTLGSEMAAGVRNLIVKDCLFLNTDRGLRIKTRRGRGKDAVIDNVVFENIRMNHVLSPFVVNSFYWDCDPDGHTEYVASKNPLPLDDRTPVIKSMVFKHIKAHNCHVCGTFIYGLPEAKIQNITMEDIEIDYCDNPTPEFPDLLADVEKITKMGIYVHNVQYLKMDNIRITGQEGSAWIIHQVDNFFKDGKRVEEGEDASNDKFETEFKKDFAQ